MYNEAVFRYKVSNLDLIIPGEDTIELTPDTIIEMQIDNDYDANFFPIFRLNMNTSLKNIYKIKLTNAKSPITNRNCPEFNDYYNEIWQEFDHEIN